MASVYHSKSMNRGNAPINCWPDMETPDQVKDRERLRRYIHREQLASVMNNSKWRRLVAVLEGFPVKCTFRRKDVRESMLKESRWDGDFYHVFSGGWASIEWIEINARRGQLVPPDVDDRTIEFRKALRDANIPYTIEDGETRVWGYTRPGQTLQWESA